MGRGGGGEGGEGESGELKNVGLLREEGAPQKDLLNFPERKVKNEEQKKKTKKKKTPPQNI